MMSRHVFCLSCLDSTMYQGQIKDIIKQMIWRNGRQLKEVDGRQLCSLPVTTKNKQKSKVMNPLQPVG